MTIAGTLVGVGGVMLKKFQKKNISFLFRQWNSFVTHHDLHELSKLSVSGEEVVIDIDFSEHFCKHFIIKIIKINIRSTH